MSEEMCPACLALRKAGPQILPYLTESDDTLCGFHASELRADRDRLAATLGEIAEVLGDLARRSPELQLNEKVEARAALKGGGA